MERIVYSTLNNYFHTLEMKGYVPYTDSSKALILSFYWEYIYNTSGHTIDKDEYRMIEKALNCLYGSTCLIPYPDYIKLGNTSSGQVLEIDVTLNAMGNVKVVKGKNHIRNIPDIDLSLFDQIDDKVDG